MDINKQLSEESRDNKKIQSFIMKTYLRFVCAFRSISPKFFLETMFFFWWTVTLTELAFVNKVRLFSFSAAILYSSMSVPKLLIAASRTLFFLFQQSPFEASVKLLHFFFSPMLQCISNVLIESFSTSRWLTEFEKSET